MKILKYIVLTIAFLAFVLSEISTHQYSSSRPSQTETRAESEIQPHTIIVSTYKETARFKVNHRTNTQIFRPESPVSAEELKVRKKSLHSPRKIFLAHRALLI